MAISSVNGQSYRTESDRIKAERRQAQQASGESGLTLQEQRMNAAMQPSTGGEIGYGDFMRDQLRNAGMAPQPNPGPMGLGGGPGQELTPQPNPGPMGLGGGPGQELTIGAGGGPGQHPRRGPGYGTAPPPQFGPPGFSGGGFGPAQFSNMPPQMPPQFGGFGGFSGAPQFGGGMMMGPPSPRFGGGMPQGGGLGGFPPPGMQQFGGGFGGGGFALPPQFQPNFGGGFGGGMGPMPQFGGSGQRQPMFGGGGFGGPQGMPQFGGGFQPPQFAMPQFGGLLGVGGGMPSNMGPQRPQNKSMVEAASQQMQNMPPMMGDMQYRGGPMTPEQEAFGIQREQDMLRQAGLNPGVSQAAYRRRNVNGE